MSRRHRAAKREIIPDARYNSTMLTKFINKVMLSGKKSLAESIVYEALERFAKKVEQADVLNAFEMALENVRPSLEVKSRRIGGATYQVPVEIPAERRTVMAMGWIIKHSRAKPGRSMVNALSQELVDCFQGQGTSVKKKDDMHRMAEANKAFAHYKW